MQRLARVLTLGALTIGALSAMALGATPVWAAAFGELGQVGSFGTTEGKFQWPIDLAVDPSDNSAYVLDTQQAEVPIAGAGPASFRVQKFAAGLAPKPTASVTISTPAIGSRLQTIAGMAVDPVLHRLYLLKAIETTVGGAYEFVGEEIEVFSTQESGGTLTPEGTFYKFPAPPTLLPAPAGTLASPHGLAVDPTTHDLIVLGADESNNTFIQRIHAEGEKFTTGKLTDSFDDLTQSVDAPGLSATGLTVGPDGKIYLVALRAAGQSGPGVVTLSSDFKSTALLHEDESEPIFLTGGKFETYRDVGPQISVAPEGNLLYAYQSHKPEQESSPKTAGSYEIRGMSTSNGTRQIVYGGAEGNQQKCAIASQYNAVAAGSSGVVYALDEGNVQLPSQNEGHTPYGFDLIEFGPGGSGCPVPSASFTINGNAEATEAVKVEKGSEAKLLAASENLQGGEPKELEWKVEGPEPATKVVSSGCPSTCLSLAHWFLKPGDYKVTLDMKVVNSPFGSPAPVTRNVEVTAPLPTASFEASTLSSKPGETVTFNGEGSLDPAGSCTPEVGCSPTSHLKSYIWSFEDGQTATTTTPIYARTFTNSSTEARSETATLIVVSDEELQSTPTTVTLTIQGEPASNNTPTGSQPTNVIPVTKLPGNLPNTKSKALTRVQKLMRALKACKKIKQKRSRMSCEKLAKRRYGSKPKSKKGSRSSHK